MSTRLDQEKAEAFAARLFNSTIGSMDILAIYIGDRLGLYQALVQGGPATPGQLANRAGIYPRYAREWLDQQAATGILEVNDAALPEARRQYSLSPAYAAVLTDPDSLYSVAPIARAMVACAQTLPKVLEAFRTGGGVGWADYGADMIESQGDFNRPWLVRQLGTEYLPSIPVVHARLQGDPPARVADVACGVGWASIAIARAYPKVVVHGFDLDAHSIALARQYAAEAGVSDRVGFKMRDVADPSLRGQYDLALVIEAIHDLSKPVEVLDNIRCLLVPGGTAIIADERVSDVFTAPGDELERLFYGFSVLCCLPTGMAEQPSAGTGTVMRASTLSRYAAQAGFKGVQVLNIEHPLLRFYQLTP